jgi:hypothetical protein
MSFEALRFAYGGRGLGSTVDEFCPELDGLYFFENYTLRRLLALLFLL